MGIQDSVQSRALRARDSMRCRVGVLILPNKHHERHINNHFLLRPKRQPHLIRKLHLRLGLQEQARSLLLFRF